MRSETSTKTGGTWDLLKRATILLTVETSTKTSFGPEDIGSMKLSLSASVMPRRQILVIVLIPIPCAYNASP